MIYQKHQEQKRLFAQITAINIAILQFQMKVVEYNDQKMIQLIDELRIANFKQMKCTTELQELKEK